MIGKHVKGNSFEDIIIEAGICANGSPHKVLSGKYYNHALRVHKLMLEALKRLIIKGFQRQEESSEALNDETQNLILQLSEKPDSEKFMNVITRKDF